MNRPIVNVQQASVSFNDAEKGAIEEHQDDVLRNCVTLHGREPSANGEHFDHPIEIISGTVINEHNQVRHLVHQSFMPEYPMTAEDGVCYVIYVGHMSAPEVENLHKQIQYGKGDSNKSYHRTAESPLLNGAVCKMKKYQCSGVKVCPRTSDEIKRHEHQEVDESTWLRLQFAREHVVNQRQTGHDQDPLRATTFTYFEAHRNQKSATACAVTCPNSGLRMVKTRTSQDAISCNQYQAGDRLHHYFRTIPATQNIDRNYLKALCDATGNNQQAVQPAGSSLPPSAQLPCDFLETVRSRRQTCPHHGSSQMITTLQCEVEFVFLTPKDLQGTPYFLFANFGCHKHPPPPPCKVPEDLAQDITKMIQRIDEKSLTIGKFLQSRMLKEFLAGNNASQLADLHPSLANNAQVARLIKKQKLLLSPLGNSYNGAVHYFLMVPGGNEYIRHIENDGETIIIICFTDQQAEHIKDARFLQVDMTYKRVLGDINELVYACLDQTLNRALTVARVFVNSEAPHIYQKVFTKTFELLGTISGHNVQWQHIHGCGMYGLVVDMCPKQCSGFGSYLHSLDASRDWREHLQFTLIYCAVHFARGIQQKFGNLEARPLMLALLTEQNQQHIDEILHTLTNHHKPAVRQWVRHKKIPWIFSGINPIATKMRRDVFISQQRSSNLVESTHANTDRTGTGLSLLTAIISAQAIDTQPANAVDNYTSTGVRPGSEFTTPIQRVQRNIARSGHGQSRPSIQEPIEQVDLSGSPQPPKRKRKTQAQREQEVLDATSSTGIARKSSKKSKQKSTISSERHPPEPWLLPSQATSTSQMCPGEIIDDQDPLLGDEVLLEEHNFEKEMQKLREKEAELRRKYNRF